MKIIGKIVRNILKRLIKYLDKKEIIVKIVNRLEKIEVNYIDDIEQQIHEEEMIKDGWYIIGHQKSGNLTKPHTLFEKQKHDKNIGIIRY